VLSKLAAPGIDRMAFSWEFVWLLKAGHGDT
jgi:hypothetical protein